MRALRGASGSSPRGGDTRDDRLQKLRHAGPFLGAGQEDILLRQSENLFDLAADPVRVCQGEIDLVDDGKEREVMAHRQIGVGQGLGLYPLDRVDDEQGPLAGGKTSRNLIGEVHMPRSIDEVKDIGGPILGPVAHAHCLGLDGDPPLPLDVHPVEELVCHLSGRDGPGQLQEAVSQGGLAVVHVGDDREIPKMFQAHSSPSASALFKFSITGTGRGSTP